MAVEERSIVSPEREWADLTERRQLILSRILEIEKETEHSSKPEDLFWYACCECILGRDEQFGLGDYHRCEKLEGRKDAAYYAVLSAQLLLISDYREAAETELELISMELFVEIFGIQQYEDNIAAFRDALYWFYSDYCELFLNYALRRIEEGCSLCFGGPGLFLTEKTAAKSVWRQHRHDYGLYMGKRYAERFRHALASLAGRYPNTSELADLILEEYKDKSQCGFWVTPVQKEELKKLALAAAANKAV